MADVDYNPTIAIPPALPQSRGNAGIVAGG